MHRKGWESFGVFYLFVVLVWFGFLTVVQNTNPKGKEKRCNLNTKNMTSRKERENF